MNRWSPSRIKCYETCPRQYKGCYLEGIKSEPGPAAQRGLNIHAKAEHYLNGNIRGLPRELEPLAPQYRKLKKADPLVEIKLAVDENWIPVSWDKGWARGILDVLANVDGKIIIIDHKTGRIYDHHEEQGSVYACLVAANNEADNYHVEFWYIDHGEIRDYDYSAEEIPAIQESWTERVNRMFTAKRFPETPSEMACKWCPVSSKKGGPCHGWKKV